MRKRFSLQSILTLRQGWLQPLTDQGGVALVVTLLIVTLVAVIVLDVNYLTRVDVHASANFRDGVRSYYLAKGGIHVTREVFSRNIQELEALKNALLLGGTQTLPLGDGEVTVRVVDETGKINLNALVIDAGASQTTPPGGGQQLVAPSTATDPQAASPWILIIQDLFQRLDIDPLLVDAIVDWIDIDDIPTGAGGAESTYYRSLDRPYTTRNGTMETIAELRLIRGFNDEVLLKLGARRVGGIVDPATNPYLTALPLPQGGGWRVNLNTAPPLILSSLTREVGRYAEIIVQRRNQGRIEKINDLQQLGIAGEALQDFSRLGTLDSVYYSIESRASVGEMSKQVSALIKGGGNQGESEILYWRVQ
jgi:general secretion pathway protein K